MNFLLAALALSSLVFAAPNGKDSVPVPGIKLRSSAEAKFEVKDKKPNALTLQLRSGTIRFRVAKSGGVLPTLTIVGPLLKLNPNNMETEFEVSVTKEKVELHPVEGEVVVVSPAIQTLVPEVVKAGEGFVYTPKPPSFSRVPFAPKMGKDPILK